MYGTRRVANHISTSARLTIAPRLLANSSAAAPKQATPRPSARFQPCSVMPKQKANGSSNAMIPPMAFGWVHGEPIREDMASRPNLSVSKLA